MSVDSNSVRHQGVQSLFNAPSEFFTAGGDFHTEVIEVFTRHSHLGVLVVVGTPHLRSQVCATSFDLKEGIGDDDRLLRKQGVAEMVGLHPRSINRYVDRRDLPKPIYLDSKRRVPQ